MPKFNMGDLLEKEPTKKEEDIPKPESKPKEESRKKQKIEKPIQDGNSEFEPMTSWYRGTAELLRGKSVRGTELNAVNVIIQELEKRKQKLLS